MGCLRDQNDYFESLFRRTTASYRAKVDKASAAAESPKEFSKRPNDKNSRRKKHTSKSKSSPDENQRPSNQPQSFTENNSASTTILDDYYEVWKSERLHQKQTVSYAYSVPSTVNTQRVTRGYQGYDNGNRNQAISEADLNAYIHDWQTKLVLNDQNGQTTEPLTSYKHPEDIHISNARSRRSLKATDENTPQSQRNPSSISSTSTTHPKYVVEGRNGNGNAKILENPKIKDLVHDMVLDEFRKQFQDGLDKNIDKMKTALITKHSKPNLTSQSNSTGIKNLAEIKTQSNRSGWRPLMENYHDGRRVSPKASSLLSHSPAASSRSHGVICKLLSCILVRFQSAYKF